MDIKEGETLPTETTDREILLSRPGARRRDSSHSFPMPEQFHPQGSEYGEATSLVLKYERFGALGCKTAAICEAV